MKRALGIAAWALLTCGAVSARAEEAADLQGLLEESVVTTASQSAQAASDAPATATTITAEQLRLHGIQSLDEAIDFLSLGAMTSSSLGDVDIGARGVMIPADQGAHFLLLVDGHAINEPLYGSARFDRSAGVPIELVDHIEVILGPGSVLYGSNAMFGVINVITKRAKHFRGPHIGAEIGIGKADASDIGDRSKLGAPARVESYRGAAGVGLPFTVWRTTGELALGVDYYRQEGPAFVLGPQGPSSEDRALAYRTRYSRTPGPGDGIWGGVADKSYSFEGPSLQGHAALGDVELNFHASMYKRRAPFTRLEAGSTPDFNTEDNWSIERSAWGDVRYRARASQTTQVVARVYADSREIDRQTVASLWAPCATTGYCRYFSEDARYDWRGASRWIGAEVQTTFDWLTDGSLATMLGVDARTVFVGSKLDTLDYANPGVPAGPSLRVIDEGDRTLGVYLQQSWRPIPAFSLNAGVRADMSRGYSAVASPRAAANLSVWHDATLKAIFAQAFRAPTWDERLGQDYVLLPAAHLNPEHVQAEEASLEQRLGPHRLSIGAFHSKWTDLIERHVLTQAEVTELQRTQGLVGFAMNRSEYRNLSEIEDYGFDFAAEGALLLAQLRYGLNFTGAFARRTAGGVEQLVPVAPRFFGNARLSYDFRAPWPVVALATHFTARRPADRAVDGVFESGPPYAPAQIELRAALSGPVPAVPGLSYRLSVNYAVAGRGPYVVGIYQGFFSNEIRDPYGELVPVERLKTSVGLQYDLP